MNYLKLLKQTCVDYTQMSVFNNNPLIFKKGNGIYLWDVNENPDAPGGLEAIGLNEAAQHHANTFQIQTSEGIFNPFKKPIDDALAGLDIPNIEAGSQTVGLFVDRPGNEEYKAQLEAGDFTNPQGLTGTFVQNEDGSTHISPHSNIVSIYDKDGNLLGNNPLLYNQNPGSTADLTKVVNTDKDNYLTDPLVLF